MKWTQQVSNAFLLGLFNILQHPIRAINMDAAFDTNDNDNLFCNLEKFVGNCGNALKLIKS